MRGKVATFHSLFDAERIVRVRELLMRVGVRCGRGRGGYKDGEEKEVCPTNLHGCGGGNGVCRLRVECETIKVAQVERSAVVSRCTRSAEKGADHVVWKMEHEDGR